VGQGTVEEGAVAQKCAMKSTLIRCLNGVLYATRENAKLPWYKDMGSREVLGGGKNGEEKKKKKSTEKREVLNILTCRPDRLRARVRKKRPVQH